MDGLHYIFMLFTLCSGLSGLLTALVGNTNLNRQKPLTGVVNDGETTAHEELVERPGDEEMALENRSGRHGV